MVASAPVILQANWGAGWVLAMPLAWNDALKTTLKRVSISLLLGGLTVAAAVCAERWLPYSSLRDGITDAITLPGFLIARIFYPAGVHTGHGAPNWGIVFLRSNFVFYSLLWLAILLGGHGLKTRAANPHTTAR